MEPTIELNSSNGRREVTIRSLLLSQRKVFLTGIIDDNAANAVIMQLMYLQDISDEPVSIIINSTGGEVNSGLAIYDMIQNLHVPVYMYCTGIAASMASLILAGGQKGRRYILPHSMVMIHEPYIAGGVGGSAGNVQNTARQMLKIQQTFNSLLAKCTGKTVEEIEKSADHDNFLDAEETVQFGICDQVIPGPIWEPKADDTADPLDGDYPANGEW